MVEVCKDDFMSFLSFLSKWRYFFLPKLVSKNRKNYMKIFIWDKFRHSEKKLKNDIKMTLQTSSMIFFCKNKVRIRLDTLPPATFESFLYREQWLHLKKAVTPRLGMRKVIVA